MGSQRGRILLTHDIDTMIGFANDRLEGGQQMAGLFAVHDDAQFGQVIDDLLAIVGASESSEWENRVVFLPL